MCGSTENLLVSVLIGTANGYTALWVGAIASGGFFYYSFDLLRSFMAKGVEKHVKSQDQALAGFVFVASLMVLIQGAFECNRDADVVTQGCTGYVGWSIAAGCISAAIALLLVLVAAVAPYTKYFGVFLSCWWFAEVATCCFVYVSYDDAGAISSYDGGVPNFTIAANGFFGSWAAFFASLILSYSAWMGGITITGQSDEEGPDPSTTAGNADGGVTVNANATAVATPVVCDTEVEVKVVGDLDAELVVESDAEALPPLRESTIEVKAVHTVDADLPDHVTGGGVINVDMNLNAAAAADDAA